MHGGVNAVKILVEVAAIILGLLMGLSTTVIIVYYRKEIVRAEKLRVKEKLRGGNKHASQIGNEEKDTELQSV